MGQTDPTLSNILNDATDVIQTFENIQHKEVENQNLISQLQERMDELDQQNHELESKL